MGSGNTRIGRSYTPGESLSLKRFLKSINLLSTPFSRAIVLPLLVSLLAIAGIGCDATEELISPSTPTRDSPIAPATVTPPPAVTEISSDATPSPFANTPTAVGLVLPISIAPVASNLPEYDRSSWRHWTDEDSDCQNARQEVLIAESTVAVTYQTDERCRVATGEWVGPYSGDPVDHPGDLDVDHMVPLGNAHRSGASSWDKERKREFANYLGYENHLIATTSSANRSKGANGPEEWRPPLKDYWCVYAIDWVSIKNQWGLTVTEAEYVALSEMLATCETTVLLQPSKGTPPPPSTPTVPPSIPRDLRYDPFGPDRDCGEFDTYSEALAFFLAAGGPEADPHRLDLNDDGRPCETLPGGPSASETSSPAEQAATMLNGSDPTMAPDETGCTEKGESQAIGNIGTVSQLSSRTASDCIPAPPPASPIQQRVPDSLVSTPTPASTLLLTPPVATPAGPTPEPTVSPHQPEPQVNCSDFSDWPSAQVFFESQGGPSTDPYNLDSNRDGVACSSLTGAPEGEASVPPPTAFPTSAPLVTTQPTPVSQAFADLPFDPNGPDRNCGDFSSWWDAQNFFLASGGPAIDRHRLDSNGDGTACESLLGAPKDDPEPVTLEPESLPEESEFVDRNCSDFATWREAQDFFFLEGGPGLDPHRLDRDKDKIVCEGLPGAPKE